LTNQQFNALIPNRSNVLRCRAVQNDIEFNLSFAGHRFDHYDVTPTTPTDMQNMQRANNGRLNWMAIPIVIFVGDRWISGGIHTFMHGSRMGGGNPGSGFPSRSNTPPFTTPNGGHVCLYLSNSVGGTTSATTLPAAWNTNARQLANDRAGTPNSRGRRSRAACHEAYLRGNERWNNGDIPSYRPPSASPDLWRGNSNREANRELQYLLNRHGANLVVDGSFGPLTEAAVMTFQRTNGLPVNGIVGEQTWSALRLYPDITTERDDDMRYNTVAEMPVWARETIQRLIDRQIIQGFGGSSNLDMSLDMIRLIIINDRAGAYD